MLGADWASTSLVSPVRHSRTSTGNAHTAYHGRMYVAARRYATRALPTTSAGVRSRSRPTTRTAASTSTTTVDNVAAVLR